MHQLTAMGVGEAPGRLETHDQHLGEAERAAAVEHRAQVPAGEELGDQVGDDAVLTPVVHGDDVGVGEAGCHLGLGAESPQERLVVGEGGVQHLDGNRTAQGDVLTEEDRRRCAGSHRSDQPVATAQDLTDAVGDVGSDHLRRVAVATLSPASARWPAGVSPIAGRRQPDGRPDPSRQ